MTLSVADRDRYRDVLRSSLPVETDESNNPPAAKYFVVPSGHLRALDPNVELVRGGRGVGKSSWYQALTSEEHRSLLDRTPAAHVPRSLKTFRGFGNEKSLAEHPDRQIIEGILRRGTAPQALWTAIVLWHVAERSGPGRRSEVGGSESSGSKTSRRPSHKRSPRQNTAAVDSGTTHLVLFDALDRTATTWEMRRELLRALLEVLLDLKGYRRIRGKAFVRPDMLEYGDVMRFADASKLQARAVDLDWRARDLYRLLWQRLGNSESLSASWFRRRTGSWKARGSIWAPPAELVQDDETQKNVFHEMTGPYMGTNHRRGYPYSWLPKHLADSQQHVSPRSFLLALRAAAEKTAEERNSHPWPLHYDAIKEGVRSASATRVAEIKEDVPWIDVALETSGRPERAVHAEDVDVRWRRDGTVEALLAWPEEDRPQRVGDEARGLRDELVALGIFEVIDTHKLNMADVYRVAFRLGRRGGVKPLA